MTIFRTAYDTSACEGYVLDKTVAAVEKAVTLGWFSAINAVRSQSLHPAVEEFIYLIQNDQGQIPSFAHPLLFKANSIAATNNEVDNKNLAVDIRGFGRWDDLNRTYVVRNQIEYQIALHRASLNGHWLRESPTILRDISKLPLTVYVSWLSEAVARRYALEPDQQMKLAIITGIFYLSLFTERDPSEKMEEREKLRVTNVLSQALRIKAKDVIAILDEVDVIPNVKAYVNTAQALVGSVRLNDFSVGTLYALIGSSWYTNTKEIITVAIEHPPTWISLLIAATTERIFKNSVIARLIERQGKDAGRDFLMPVLNLIKVKSL